MAKSSTNQGHSRQERSNRGHKRMSNSNGGGQQRGPSGKKKRTNASTGTTNSKHFVIKWILRTDPILCCTVPDDEEAHRGKQKTYKHCYSSQDDDDDEVEDDDDTRSRHGFTNNNDNQSEEEPDEEQDDEEEELPMLKQRLLKEQHRNAKLKLMVQQQNLELPQAYRHKIDTFINKEAWNFMKVIYPKNLQPGTLFMTKFLEHTQISMSKFRLYYKQIMGRITKKISDKRNLAVSNMKTVFESTSMFMFVCSFLKTFLTKLLILH